MTDGEHKAWVEGNAAAWRELFGHALRNLGDLSDIEQQVSRLLLERTDAIATLRRVCAEYGDLDWDTGTHLSDIITNHLEKHFSEETERGQFEKMTRRLQDAGRGFVHVQELEGGVEVRVTGSTEGTTIFTFGADGVLTETMGSEI